MYINPFIAGVLATIMVGLVLTITLALSTSKKK